MTQEGRDPTLDRDWLNENMDRMVGYEILQRSLRGEYQEVDPVTLEETVGADYGFCTRTIKKIRSLLR